MNRMVHSADNAFKHGHQACGPQMLSALQEQVFKVKTLCSSTQQHWCYLYKTVCFTGLPPPWKYLFLLPLVHSGRSVYHLQNALELSNVRRPPLPPTQASTSATYNHHCLHGPHHCNLARHHCVLVFAGSESWNPFQIASSRVKRVRAMKFLHCWPFTSSATVQGYGSLPSSQENIGWAANGINSDIKPKKINKLRKKCSCASEWTIFYLTLILQI